MNSHLPENRLSLLQSLHSPVYLFTYRIIFLFVFVIGLAACSSAKKTTAKTPSHKITQLDILKGGTSFENAVVIKVRNEADGLREEYNWLAQSYPGYSLIRKNEASKATRHYHIITFKTRIVKKKSFTSMSRVSLGNKRLIFLPSLLSDNHTYSLRVL